MTMGNEELGMTAAALEGASPATASRSEDIDAGEAFRRTMIERADSSWGGAPLWHGWAIMEAFLAGAEHARKATEVKQQ